MQEEWGHELPAEEGVYTGEVVTGEVVGEVVSGGPVEGEVYGKVVPVEFAGEQPAARIDLPPGRYPATGLSQWKWGHKPHPSARTYRAHNVREGGHWQCEGHPGYRGRMQPISEERRAVIAGRHQNALRVWEGPYGDKGMYENGSNEGTQRWMLLPEGVLRVDHIHWGWAARGSTDYEAGGYTYYFAPPQALLDVFGLAPPSHVFKGEWKPIWVGRWGHPGGRDSRTRETWFADGTGTWQTAGQSGTFSKVEPIEGEKGAYLVTCGPGDYEGCQIKRLTLDDNTCYWPEPKQYFTRICPVPPGTGGEVWESADGCACSIQ